MPGMSNYDRWKTTNPALERADRDALRFERFCDHFGYDPEDERTYDLYEQACDEMEDPEAYEEVDYT